MSSDALRSLAPRASIRGWLLAAVAVVSVPAWGAGASQEQLEKRVDALQQQLEALKAELAQIKKERAAEQAVASAKQGALPTPGALPATPGAGTQTQAQTATPGAANSSALPDTGTAIPQDADYAAPLAQARIHVPTFFGYGELNYSHPRENSSDTFADVARFVLGVGYRFDDKTRFVSELELEHGVSSASDPGEVEVEQAYIERDFGGGTFGRAGLILIPSGMLNESHEPTRYYGVFRNFVETAIIPSTWREGGISLEGNTESGLRWDVGVTTGFDISKWDAASEEGHESPLGAIHGELALAHARDLSGFGAVNYTGVPGLRVGASIFGGGVSQGQPDTAKSSLVLWEGHARWAPGSWDLAALYARGHLTGTGELNQALIGNPTLIPENFFGWYMQAAYHFLDNGTRSVTPFIRYERFNTASAFADLGQGLTPSVTPDRKVWTGGVNWMIAPGVVIKADYLDFENTSIGDRFDLGIGYQF